MFDPENTKAIEDAWIALCAAAMILANIGGVVITKKKKKGRK